MHLRRAAGGAAARNQYLPTPTREVPEHGQHASTSRPSPRAIATGSSKFDGDVAELIMDVDENAGLFEGYQLKLNSYDLGVDIELADAVQRLRFEHPEVKVVVLKSGKDRVFCAGANIRMLAGSSHAPQGQLLQVHQRDAQRHGGRERAARARSTCAPMRGTAAGGGYELALATDHILLADDGNSTVALPELPLLAVLPGTGGLTRVTDKRKVRRDLADAFCTVEEGVQGRARRQVAAGRPGRAELQVRAGRARTRRSKLAAQSDRPARRQGHRADADRAHDRRRCRHLFEREGRDRPRDARAPRSPSTGPSAPPPASAEAMHGAGRRSSGRCGSPASWTMPSCTCASTSPRSAC